MQIIDCLAITAVQCFFVLLTEMPSKPQSNSIYNTFTGWVFFPHWVCPNYSSSPHSYIRYERQSVWTIGTRMPRAHCSAPDSWGYLCSSPPQRCCNNFTAAAQIRFISDFKPSQRAMANAPRQGEAPTCCTRCPCGTGHPNQQAAGPGGSILASRPPCLSPKICAIIHDPMVQTRGTKSRYETRDPHLSNTYSQDLNLANVDQAHLWSQFRCVDECTDGQK